MKRILTDNASHGQPLTAPTSLDWLQDALLDGLRDILIGMIGSTYSTSVPYILYGCETTTAPSITSGVVFFNGELFAVSAWAPGIACFGPAVPGINIVTTYAAGDPITYFDGTTHNTHRLRSAAGACGTSHTIGAFTDLRRIVANPGTTKQVTGAITALTTYFNGNQVIMYDSLGSTPTITVDLTGAIDGATVEILCATTTAGDEITFAGAGSQYFITGGSPFTTTFSTSATITMKYRRVGSNDFIFIRIENPDV